MGERTIQQRLYPEMTCFGCGPANPDGLQIRSFPDGDDAAVGTFTAKPAHTNGFGFVNGGIVSAVLDCHGAAAVAHGLVEGGLWPADRGVPPYVTAAFDVRFLRPTPLGSPLDMHAVIEHLEDDELTTSSTISQDGKVRASMTATWRRFTPRDGDPAPSGH